MVCNAPSTLIIYFFELTLSMVSFLVNRTSIPNFFFALILLYFASLTGLLPTGGMRSFNYDELSSLGKIWDVLTKRSSEC